jgi:hypothetical protein
MTCTLVELSHAVAHPIVISSALGGAWEKCCDLPLFSSDPMMVFRIIELEIMDSIVPLLEGTGPSMPANFRGIDEHGRTGHGYMAPYIHDVDSNDPLRVNGTFFAPSYGHSDLYPSMIPYVAPLNQP